MFSLISHVIFEQDLFDKLPEAKDDELDLLDKAACLTETYGILPFMLSWCSVWQLQHSKQNYPTIRSRLGCQIKVSKDFEGATVCIPEETNNA